MKSLSLVYLTLLPLVVAGSQINAMNGMLPTQVAPQHNFINRVKANSGVRVFNSTPNFFAMDAHQIQVQQELAQGALEQAVIQPEVQPSLVATYTAKAKELAQAGLAKVNQFGSTVAQKAHNAYNSKAVQQGFAKVGQARDFVAAKFNQALNSEFAQKIAQKGNQAYAYVQENPKLVAGVVAGAVATYGVYKLVKNYQTKKYVSNQPIRILTTQEADALPAALLASI
ncbi:hypothetical protein Noda2021_01750 [Candidatus Dependentiae bacterium Noda2021]|nr:hypothetical protein Noda2021_01750 [Candidatus Dependentiae bacterium Noda2021]